MHFVLKMMKPDVTLEDIYQLTVLRNIKNNDKVG